MTGLPRLTPDTLDGAQRELYDAILAGPRADAFGRDFLVREDGSLTGPFDAWTRSPVVGSLLERVGMALRVETELDPGAREAGILVVARAWGHEFEWAIHRMLGVAAGLTESDVERIKNGEPLRDAGSATSIAVAIATGLVEDRRLSPDMLADAIATLGERVVVELVMTIGFYGLVSATLVLQPPGPDDVGAGELHGRNQIRRADA